MHKKAIFIAIVLVAILTMISMNYAFYGNDHRQQGVILPASVTGVILKDYKIAGKLNPNKEIMVFISLKLRNEKVLNAYLSELQNPHSKFYHKYMSLSEFQAYFSPDNKDYFEIAKYFESYGFKVVVYSDRMSIAVYGTVKMFDNIFHTDIEKIDYNGKIIYAPITPISYSGPMVADIAQISGLNNMNVAKISPLFVNSNGTQLLYGSDFQEAYQANILFTKGYPVNKTIVTILWSGNNSSGSLVAPFIPSDISNYFNSTLPQNEPKPKVYGYPIDGAPAPGPSAAYDTTQANFESTLDLEMAGSMAPGATIVEIYGPAPTQNYLDQAFATALNNGSSFPALNNLVAISNSWGGQDTNDTAWMQYEQEAAARGITVLASSGDDGNTNSPAPSFPATMAYNNFGTIAVGGTETTLSGTQSNNGSGTTGILSQAVWYNEPQQGDGSQGGVSSIFAEPSWQTSSAMANQAIQGNSSITGVSSGRATPDIAADGANMSIYITYQGNSGYQTLWGTSVASPLVAGLVADMDNYLGQMEGFMDPLIYELGQMQANGSLSSSPPFYFIYNGSNGAFTSADGYNLVVGWGTINAYNFIMDQINLSNPTNSSSSSPTPTSSPPNNSTPSKYILASVNSTSINLYYPNESEEFTPVKSAYANYLVLYLSGSGTVNVSIGTTLWGSQILTNITVQVNPNQYWYNISLPNIYLSNGTDYYLNVFNVTGQVQWGYTSNPAASSVGYLQDYYYVSGTLNSDNSYPDIFTIGFY